MGVLPESFIFDNLPTLSIFLATVFLASSFMKKQKKLPPGPTLWPIFGYLPMLTKRDKREIFRELRAEYGDLVYLRVGSQPILLTSGHRLIHELLVKRARHFEGRPQVFTTLKPGQGKGVVNASGPAWKEHRAFLVNKMKGLGIGKTSFEENVFQEIDPFLKVIHSTRGQPYDPRFTLQTAMSNIICYISFGKRFDYDDENFVNILKLIQSNLKLVGATSIVNYFPWLERIPGDLFKCQQAMERVDTVQQMTSQWVDEHKVALDPNNPRDLIDFYLLEMQRKQEQNEETYMDESQLVKLVGDLLVAGAETTATTLQWALLFLTGNQNVQDKVFQEIKSMLGTRKHLSFQDKDAMPYTVAAILECQRLADIAPFSLAHSNAEPVTLDGYTIPGGAVVIPVLNSIHHSEELWENPMEFRPERFLDERTERVTGHKNLLLYCSGSRTCPGKNLAFMELFIFLTSILQHFRVMPGDDKDVPTLEGHIGVTYSPKEYTLRFVSRSTDLNGNMR